MALQLRTLSIALSLALGFAAVSCANPEVEVPKLIKQLKNNDAHKRNRAAMELASFGSDAEPAVRALSALLADPNGGVRSSAAFALRKIGTPEAERALTLYKK